MALRGRNSLTDEIFYFVTTSIIQHVKIFSDHDCCDALINSIKYYKKKYQFDILAYVIMPSHFHWIVEVNPCKEKISDIMRDIKKYSAWDVMDILEEKKIKNVLDVFENNSINYKDRKRKFWIRRFDDQVIRDQQMFWTKLNYIHENPVKAGLVVLPEDYKYSSARNYILDDHSVIEVNTKMGGVKIE